MLPGPTILISNSRVLIAATVEGGLTAAKDLLRHADIGITVQHYIDSPRQATSGLGALLGHGKRKGRKIIEFNQTAKTAQSGRRRPLFSRIKRDLPRLLIAPAS